MFITYSGTLLVIGASFGIIYGTEKAKGEIGVADSDDLYNYAKVQGLTIAASLVITLANNIMKIVVRKLSFYEKHDTYTAHNISVAFKLTVARFINSAIVPLVVNVSNSSAHFVLVGS